MVRRDVGHAKDMAMKLANKGREVGKPMRPGLGSERADAKGVAGFPGNLERVRDEEERKDRDLDGRIETLVSSERAEVEPAWRG